MSTDTFDLAGRESPEEQELRHKERELEQLRTRLAERELELATLERELAVFEDQYLREVGNLYAELDELELNIARIIAEGEPASREARERVSEAHERAAESARAAGEVETRSPSEKFEPSEGLKSLYRKVAKKIHPDLASTDEERQRRTELMAAANEAYASGDILALEQILSDWELSPEAIEGEDVSAKLVRTIRSIDRVNRRIQDITDRIAEHRDSELHELKTRYEKAQAEGRDLFAEIAQQLNKRIADAKVGLANLRSG